MATAAENSIDPRRLIAESSALRGKPEPEMTESERAVYEKIEPILSARPEFGLRLLQGMTPASALETKTSPAFEFMHGNALYSMERFGEAEARYRNAVEGNPGFIRAWSNLGILYYVQKRFAEAAPCFSQAVSLGDHDPATFGMLGNAFEKTGNTVSAEMAYMQALAAEPTNANWAEGLLRIYIADQQWTKAETLVRTLLANHPQDTRYWAAYVHLLLSSNRKLEATALLERMSATDLIREKDLILLADLYAELRLTAEALATWVKVAVTQPLLVEQKQLQFARGMIATRAWDDALTVLEALASAQLSAAGNIARLEARVELEIARKRWVEAKGQLGVLLEAAPSNGNAWISLGRICLAEADPAKAVEAFERAHEIPESEYRASIELTNIAFKNRDYARCLRLLDHALSIQPSAAIENFRNQIQNLLPPERQKK